MIRAAICDDENTVLDYLYEHVSKEFEKQGVDVHIDKYISGRNFLNAHKKEQYDAVFLDIDMPEISGFDVSEKISEKALIIFVTTHDELVFSSLKFQPFRFIRKSYIDNEIEETVKAISDKVLKNRANRRIKFQTREKEIYIFASNIEYIEVYDHWLRVYTNGDKTIECYGSLLEFEKTLAPIGFARTHKSYLVNLKYLNSIEKSQVILDNGTEIPVSRYKASEVREKLKEYLRGEL